MKTQDLIKILAVSCTAGAIAVGCAKPRYNSTALAFADYCTDSAPAAETEKTVDALKELSGQEGCLDAGQALSSMTKMDLSGKELSDMAPVAVFGNIKSLDISNNRVTYLGPITRMSALEEINVDSNQGITVEGIKKLSGIETLKTVIVPGHLSGADVESIRTAIPSARVRKNEFIDRSEPESAEPEAAPTDEPESAEEAPEETPETEGEENGEAEAGTEVEGDDTAPETDAETETDSEESPEAE